nr:ATP-grasp domain-containing protein [Demequina litorisediminis]
MSSSGKGQSVVRDAADAARAWDYAAQGARAVSTRLIVEAFVDFDYEITQLTVRHAGGTTFLDPVGHIQIDGDYRESWQPHPMPEAAVRRARQVAGAVTEALGGYGVFGVEPVHPWRRGDLQRGLAAPARHGPGDPGVPATERVRAARTSHPRHRPAGRGRGGARRLVRRARGGVRRAGVRRRR